LTLTFRVFCFLRQPSRRTCRRTPRRAQRSARATVWQPGSSYNIAARGMPDIAARHCRPMDGWRTSSSVVQRKGRSFLADGRRRVIPMRPRHNSFAILGTVCLGGNGLSARGRARPKASTGSMLSVTPRFVSTTEVHASEQRSAPPPWPLLHASGCAPRGTCRWRSARPPRPRPRPRGPGSVAGPV
jgi:hypothetical protein